MQRGSCCASPPRRKRNEPIPLAEVRLRRSARKEIGPASPALSLYSSERRPRPAWQRPAILQAHKNPYFFFLVFLVAMIILPYRLNSEDKTSSHTLTISIC